MTQPTTRPDPAALATARLAARNVEWLIAEIEKDDLIMAQGYASMVRGQMEQLLQALAKLREHEPPSVLKAANLNPFTDPLAGRFGNMSALRAGLTDQELQEYCRYWNWVRDREPNPHSRWWCGKALTAAEHELAARGLDPQSWRDPSGPV